MKRLNIYSENFKHNFSFKIKTIYILLMFSILFITIGYSAINKELNITGTAQLNPELTEIRFTNCVYKSSTNGGIEDYPCYIFDNILKTGITLPNANSTVTYQLTVTNFSSIAMLLNTIVKLNYNNNDIEYSLTNIKLKDSISGITSKTFDLTFKYSSGVGQNTSLGSQLHFKYTKDTPVLIAGITGGATTKFLNGPIIRNEIESIAIVDNKTVPADAIGYFDVSYKKNNSVIAWYKDTDSNGLYEFYIGGDGGVSANSSSISLFSNLVNLKTFDLTYLNTALVTSMYGFFGGCSSLEELDLSNFDTGLTSNMASMFNGTTNLELIDFSNLDMSKVQNMTEMFKNSGVKTIKFSNTSATTNLVNMSSIFLNTANLEEIVWGNFSTSNVTTMTSSFSGTGMEILDLSHFNTSNVTTIYGMFYAAKNLKTLIINNWDVTNITNMQNSFASTSLLEEINLSGWNMNSVTNLTYTFQTCAKLKTIDMRSALLSFLTSYTSIVNGSNAIEQILVNQENYDLLMASSIATAFKNKLVVV
ncbi:MAG: BspA family leucine-rich repeat surface protein [Tenericutes bacterium]|nr:BspA family leucine-rich repeat surface protein [Mycoplasmatota bacterium]